MLVLYRNFHSSIYFLNNRENIVKSASRLKIKLVEATKSSVVRVQNKFWAGLNVLGACRAGIYASD